MRNQDPLNTDARMRYESPRGLLVLDMAAPNAPVVRVVITNYSVTSTLRGYEITPWRAGGDHSPSYETSMVKKSSPDNTGRIFFRSNNTDYTIREVLLSDADWLFPERTFYSASVLERAIEQKLRRDSTPAVESKQEGNTSD